MPGVFFVKYNGGVVAVTGRAHDDDDVSIYEWYYNLKTTKYVCVYEVVFRF